jgi:hypothetical protein
VCKIKPIECGLTNITGIKYEVFSVGGVQFIDKNGNGLFYNYCNISKELFSNKKDKISLKNIKVNPEIPILDIKFCDSSKSVFDTLELYENQYYEFDFELENIGNYNINEIIVNVYAFKKDDYKVIIDEIKVNNSDTGNYYLYIDILISTGQSYNYKYKYLHRKTHKKIEFKIYYITESNPSGLKPYLYYQKALKTIKLLELSCLKAIPVLSNNIIHQISMLDPSNIIFNKEINRDFSKHFCSDRYYVSFSVTNIHNDLIKFDIYSKNDLIKKELCEHGNSKEISFIVNSEIKLNEFAIEWEFDKHNNLRGRFDLGQIFKEFSFKFSNSVNIILI